MYACLFRGYRSYQQKLDGYYVDGLSITYDNSRQHIWTYATGACDNITYIATALVQLGDYLLPLLLVKTITVNQVITLMIFFLYIILMTHCGMDLVALLVVVVMILPMQPWFYHELSGATTSNIEARICDVRVWLHNDWSARNLYSIVRFN